MKELLNLALLAASSILVSACNSQSKADNEITRNTGGAVAPASGTDPVVSAESAAPASIAHKASIVTMDANGAMTVLRKGGNGWTCIPDSPATPGPDPMCADANAMKWADAWIHHTVPPAGVVGLIYMLEGGTDASNTDPYAAKPTSANNWIKTGPHVMIVGSKDILTGHPSGPNPDTSAPYVMWAGTPYAHLMVQVGK